ncbi:hypothetical protein [Virgibacillus halodenitrificans]|uniref:hypothetical protein n=1 Tax=Virgibacillus halodenitrificans TaxID=1482 RepID=UPI000EF527C1|nr:hypothetical protein [Virgibacillus halodenitrificans]
MTNNNNFKQTDIFALFEIEEEQETQTISLNDLTEQSEQKDSKEGTTEENTSKRGRFEKVIPENSKEDSKDKKVEEKKKLSTFEDTKKNDSKASNSTSKSKSSAGVGDEFKLKTDTVINYAGQEIPVTRYFSVDEITNGVNKKKKGEVVTEPVSDKDLIRKLNKDFAELVPQLTSLVFFEKKNIVVPVLQARKKGANVTKEESLTDSSFSSPLRIPFQLLQNFISIARNYSEHYGTEIHADIYFDYDQEKFFMDFPKQVVHAIWAERIEEPQETALKFINRSYRKIMEIHSHHKMAPIPSSTDNESERSPILYAIVGRIDSYFPEVTVRTFSPSTQKHIPLKMEQVFEYPFKQTSIQYNLNGVEVEE